MTFNRSDGLEACCAPVHGRDSNPALIEEPKQGVESSLVVLAGEYRVVCSNWPRTSVSPVSQGVLSNTWYFGV